jgi:eukaryotic-like serine/threonine-protein kinase
MRSRHQRAKDLFLAAMAQKVEDRVAFVANACGTDMALRREVESLLAFAEESHSGGGTASTQEKTTEIEKARFAPRSDFPSGPPTDLLSEAASRLSPLALLYALVFFTAEFLPKLVFPQDLVLPFSRFALWGPGAISIAVALVVAALIRSARIPLPAKMNIGLAFEVAGSYGIAATQFLPSPGIVEGQWMGLSWVAVWTMLFTVVVPTRPRRALIAALASVSAVPVVLGCAIAAHLTSFIPSLAQFFLGLVFPYLLVVVMAYAGARVIYTLGTEVSRARELGSYRLVERLGQGGMGEVWRAKHRLLARPAAIKLIRPSLTKDGPPGVSENARRRFEREAQVIARLRSPHTVTLFDFGVAADGAFYYVMELLEGLDAETLVKSTGPVPAERAIHVLRQVCHSLSEAESYGLVHRDIKPANIFLCRYGEEYDFVKVLDFGIVKASTGSAEIGNALTQDLTIQGTPAFMAPEQAVAGAEVDGRADIYAAGCVAYWLLTGQFVFTADSAMALLLHHAQTSPLPPSARTELPIPAALDDLVLACLAKNPADRPPTARELARRLAFIERTTEWTENRAREWWMAHWSTASRDR